MQETVAANAYIYFNGAQVKVLELENPGSPQFLKLKSYISVIHANVYQTIKVRNIARILHDGTRELARNEADFSKYALLDENKEIGEKLSKIGSRLDYPHLNKELAQEIETLWKDGVIQEAYSRVYELEVLDCTQYFMENLHRLADVNYVPTKTAEIERRIELETKAEKHIQKLLLLGAGAGESGEPIIFKQIKLLFQIGFNDAELKSYISVIHACVSDNKSTQYLQGYCIMGQRNRLKMEQISQSMLYWMKIRKLERNYRKLVAGWIILTSIKNLHKK